MQDTQEQNFGDERGKRIVIGSCYVQPDRRGVTDRLGRLLEMWEEELERRAKLNRQADYCFKIQGKYILKKSRRTCDNYIKKSSVKHWKYT